MKTRKLFTFFILIILSSVLILSGCSINKEKSINGNTVLDNKLKPVINVDKLEIYHFHGTHQCYSCRTVGAYTEETINTYFKEELDSGKIIFDHINGELPENRDLVSKYGAMGSSLWLGVYNKNEFHKEENVNVWYKISDKQAYMGYLKGLIERRLTGEFN